MTGFGIEVLYYGITKIPPWLERQHDVRRDFSLSAWGVKETFQ